MIIGQRLRQLRQQKHLRHADIEETTGLRRAYTSRVECGRTIPSIQNLQKYAMALGVPLFRLFYDGDSPQVLSLSSDGEAPYGRSGKESQDLRSFTKAFKRMNPRDRKLLLALAKKILVRRLFEKNAS